MTDLSSGRPASLRRTHAAIVIPALLFLGALVVFCLRRHISIGVLTRDPNALAKLPPFAGMLSNIGMLFWCSAAAISLFTAFVLRARMQKEEFRFLLASAGVTLMLLCDDLFQIHETVAEAVAGIHEKAVYAAMGLVVLAYFARYRRLLLASRWSLLFMACAGMGVSLVVDIAEDKRWLWKMRDWIYLLEDGAKFLGIVYWCAFYAATARLFFLGALAEERTSAAAARDGVRTGPAPLPR